MDFNFTIYIYDTVEDLKNGMKKRGYNDPDYMCACHKDEDNSLNFFEPVDSPIDNEWSKEDYENVIFHELIHGIQYSIYGEHPEWLTEGIAKYLDGTYSKGIKWLLENFINKNLVPTMNEIVNEFGCHDYDSYDYAYLMVCYLLETLGKSTFLIMLKNKNLIEEFSDNLVQNAIDYYNGKFIDSKKII